MGDTASAPEACGTHGSPACTLLLLTHVVEHGYGRVTPRADVRNVRSRAGIEKLGAPFVVTV